MPIFPLTDWSASSLRLTAFSVMPGTRVGAQLVGRHSRSTTGGARYEDNTGTIAGIRATRNRCQPSVGLCYTL